MLNVMPAVSLSAFESIQGRANVSGYASGKVLWTDVALSFWGGINPQTGEIIDRHHPLSGQCTEDVILALPGGRGSCTGSAIMLELLLSGKGPKALIIFQREDILTLGVIVAEELFKKSIPVVQLNEEQFRTLRHMEYAQISGNLVTRSEPGYDHNTLRADLTETWQSSATESIELSERDKTVLEGAFGDAARIAMRIVLRMARIQNVPRLIDIAQVHVDGCVYTGPGCLAFAEKLRDMGGKVLVPTSLNSISVDQRRWRVQGIDITFGEASERLASAYTDLGALPTFTCAPYLLATAPKRGEQVAWAESNAVVYANSVLGARTMKYPDFLDICIALTGRAPEGGVHVSKNRIASLCVHVSSESMNSVDDSFYPLLGYCVGGLAGGQIPAVIGLEDLSPSLEDLKAFGAAFATTSSAPMFHIVQVTPEAPTLEAALGTSKKVKTVEIGLDELASARRVLNTAKGDDKVDLVSLGNPHFSVKDIRRLIELCRGRTKKKDVSIIITCSRSTHGLASQAGLITELELFGVLCLTDTCWCMIVDPVIPREARTIMTNSAKYAHYGPGLTGRKFRFGSLSECVDAAC